MIGVKYPLRRPSRRRSQNGMVSMMVTMMMLLVITLIILGFAQVSRREQRQSLDRQLSTQAFFAAESGVNDTRKAIQGFQALGLPIPEKDKCEPSTEYPKNPVIDAANSVSYPCLLVTTKLANLNAKISNKGGSVNLPLQPDGAVDKLRVNWRAETNPSQSDIASKCQNGMPVSNYFRKSTSWDCPYGVLRVDFVPTSTLTRAAMAGGQTTVFFYPTQGGSPATLPWAAANGAVARMDCKETTNCEVDISGFPGGNYAMRISSIYQSGTVDFTAKDIFGKALELSGAQIQVDATGKAQDVLRRIQVRLAAVPSAKTPDYALQTGSAICKRFEASATRFVIPGDIKGNQDQNNPMCKPMAAVSCQVSPVDTMLLLDNSGTMSSNKPERQWEGDTRMAKLKQIASKFIQSSDLSTQGNLMGIVKADEDSTLVSELTDNPGFLIGKLQSIKAANKTYFIKALQLADAELRTGTNQRDGAAKYIILISDMDSLDENKNLIYAITDTLKKQGIKIFAIGITGQFTEEDVMKTMASPGSYIYAKDVAALDAAMEEIAASNRCDKARR